MGDVMMLILGLITGFLCAVYGAAKAVEDALHTGYQDSVREQDHAAWLFGETSTAYDLYGVKTWAVKCKCSKCGFVTRPIEAHITQYSYCPSCGARMDEVK